MNYCSKVAREFCISYGGGAVGQAAVEEMHQTAYVDLPPITAQPKGKVRLTTLIKCSQTMLFEVRTIRRVKRTHARVQKLTNRILASYCMLRYRSVKLRRGAKQHPSSPARLMRRFVRGLSINGHQFTIPNVLHGQFPAYAMHGASVVAQPYTHAYKIFPST
jgi:hypothetical protein